MSEVSTVEYLKNNFGLLSVEQQIEIKNAGRPKPEIDLAQTTKGKSRDFTRRFKMEIYEKTSWICGCSKTNRLFCFPCLLFGRGFNTEAAWKRNGVADLGHLPHKIKKHENAQTHINAQLELQLLGKVDIRRQLDSQYRHNIQQQNEKVRKNRYVLSKIIDCIKFCGAFELALRGRDGKDNSNNPGIFRGLISFTSELDIALKDHFEKSNVFKEDSISKTIQNKLLDCIFQVTQDNIKKEIANAEYVSIMVEETTDVADSFQIATVFRYVLPDGSPVERFCNFVNPTNHDAVSVADSIKSSLEQVLDRPEKLISQSYDGAIVIDGVQTLIKHDYENAFFVHCYAHELNRILSTSRNPEVRVFFLNLSDISNFFSHSPQRISVLDGVVAQRMPGCSPIRWNFENRCVNTVYEHSEFLIECMQKIEETSKQTVTINQASSIRRMLQDPKFMFWLSVFHRILPHADILYRVSQVSDPAEIHKAVREFKNSIQKERDTLGTIKIEIDEGTRTQRQRLNRTVTVNVETNGAVSEFGHLERIKIEIDEDNFANQTKRQRLNEDPPITIESEEVIHAAITDFENAIQKEKANSKIVKIETDENSITSQTKEQHLNEDPLVTEVASVKEEIHAAVLDFENSIQIERDYLEAMKIEIEENPIATQAKRQRINEDPRITRIEAAKEVCDTIITHVEERFSLTKHLNAALLFLSEKFPQFDKGFPFEHLEAIVEAYPFLDKVRLRTELELIYGRPDFRSVSGAIDLLKFFIENNLEGIFSATFTLLVMIITIPMPTTEEGRCFSTLKRIETFLRSSVSEERLTALAMLSVEKKFIESIPDFNEAVIDKFAESKSRRMDFKFRQCTS